VSAFAPTSADTSSCACAPGVKQDPRCRSRRAGSRTAPKRLADSIRERLRAVLVVRPIDLVVGHPAAERLQGEARRARRDGRPT
jgi:hypothetical protein